MQVTKVYAGSPADKAGLRAGDVIHSVNGYLTTQRGNLAWIINAAAPNGVLEMKVRSVADGKVHTILINLPPEVGEYDAALFSSSRGQWTAAGSR